MKYKELQELDDLIKEIETHRGNTLVGIVVNEEGWQKLMILRDQDPYRGMLGTHPKTMAYEWSGIPVYKRIKQKNDLTVWNDEETLKLYLARLQYEEKWGEKITEHVTGFRAIIKACGIGILDGKLFVKKKMNKIRIYYRNRKLKRINNEF